MREQSSRLRSALLLHAEAACGSPKANETLLRQILDDESPVLQEGGGETGDHTSLDAYYPAKAPVSLRVQILFERGLRYEFYPMPSDVADGLFRSALSTEGMNDWYRLYLLARIKKPTADDKEMLLRIWNGRAESMRLVIIDVLYVLGRRTDAHGPLRRGGVFGSEIGDRLVAGGDEDSRSRLDH